MINAMRAWLNGPIRQFLRKRVVNGFWFFRFQRFVDWLYVKGSLGNRFDNWLKGDGQYLRGATELYQLVIVGLGLTWAVLVSWQPPLSLVSNSMFQGLGILIAGYAVSELFVFMLHWTFVAEGALHSTRRSLAGFLLNLFVEIPAYFIVLLSLLGCQETLSPYLEHVDAIINLQTLAVRIDRLDCTVVAHSEIIIAGTLLTLVIASLVGAIVRPEKGGG